MADNTQTTEVEQKVIHLLESTEMTATEIGKEVGITRQKVTRIKQRYLKQGLGDMVESILEATGVQQLAKWLADGKDCGCEERKQRLNNLTKWTAQKCLEKEQFEYLDRFFKTWNGLYSPEFKVLNELAIIRNHVFSLKYSKPNPTCRACVKHIIEPLRKVWNEYTINE